MQDGMLLRTQAINKSFPGVKALVDVDFDLRRGEVHAILGENGAGKSTLIKILGGVYQRDSGQVLLEDRPLDLRSPRQAQLAGIRVIHQELNLLPLLSVAENIFLGNYIRGRIPGTVDQAAMNDRAGELLERLGLDLDVKTKVGRLSAGEQQLVEIAQAFTTELSVLIMDEPTGALNETEAQTLFELLRVMTARGIGIIYITHRIAEVFRIADRVTVLRDGLRVGTLPVSEASSDQLVQMMVGRSLDEMYPRSWSEVGEPILEARNLSSQDALKDINLTLHAGEILGVYGLMGSGRSRLANLLFGAIPASSGEILVRGKSVRLRSPTDARRAGIGYLPVERKTEGLVLPLTLRKNITLASLDRYARGPFIDEKSEQRGARHWSEALRIRAPSIEVNIGGLSGGNQQKAVVARWLDAQASILIMNEPTRGIDVGAKVEIYALMDELCHRGVGILMFSSEMLELLAIANRILVMSRGQITAEFAHGKPSQEDLMRSAVA
jgi:ABC-type sugar transport system ATPase subunit